MRHQRCLLVCLGLALTLPAAGQALAQQAMKPADEFAARGQREARAIKYGDWEKLCFKPGGARMVCRTSISGTFETGQTAVRLYVTEGEGRGPARLQLFLPVGL